MKKTRKFGKYTVELHLDKDENLILVYDDWFSNYGTVYLHCGLNPDERWLFGMDAEITRKDIKNWLQNNILDYLENEE